MWILPVEHRAVAPPELLGRGNDFPAFVFVGRLHLIPIFVVNCRGTIRQLPWVAPNFYLEAPIVRVLMLNEMGTATSDAARPTFFKGRARGEWPEIVN